MQSNKPNNGKMQWHKEIENDQKAGNNLEGTSQQGVQFQVEEEEETSHTEGLFDWPNHQQMKIQLPKETWFDLLAFVPRHQLGQIATQVGDRQFAAILQSFLHGYREITLGNIWIDRPRPKDASGRLDLRAWPKSTEWYNKGAHANLILPNVEMPKNIKDFLMIQLGYLDTSVLDFLEKFQQNFLFGNVNLEIGSNVSSQGRLTLLSYVLPLINNINSILACHIETIDGMYKAKSGITMDVLEMARILDIEFCDDEFEPEEMAVLKRWLYTARADGKPRVLILPADVLFSDALNFINGNIKSEFSKAKSAISFFIRIFVEDDVEWQDICIENWETKEKLVIKNVDSQKMALKEYLKMVLISRYPSNAGKKWIEVNEKEVIEWDFDEQNGQIVLNDPVKNAIPWNYEHFVRKGREAHYRHWKNDRSNSNAKNQQQENDCGKRYNDGDMEEIECRRSKRSKK